MKAIWPCAGGSLNQLWFHSYGPTDFSFYLFLSLSVFLSFSVVDTRLHGSSHRKRIIPIWIEVSGSPTESFNSNRF